VRTDPPPTKKRRGLLDGSQIKKWNWPILPEGPVEARRWKLKSRSAA
jgi:hypothetical protein